MNPSEHKILRISILVAVLAGLIGCVADTLLLYSPTGGYLDGSYEFLRGISEERMLWGHYLGIVAIPFEAAGLFLMYKALAPKSAFFAGSAVVLGIFIFIPGLVYHGSVFAIWEAVNTNDQAAFETMKKFNEPLGLGFAAGFFLLFASFTGLVLTGKTLFKKWVALFTPPVSYAICLLCYLLVPAIGNYLAPMGFNLSMAIFYFMAFRAYRPESGATA